MLRKTLILLVFLIVLTVTCPAWAGNQFNSSDATFLLRRKAEWPNWSVTQRLSRASLHNDLIYPDWFLGNWKVYSIELGSSINKPIVHFARFKYDDQNRVVGDKAFNSKSLGEKILGVELIDVKVDPSSFNKQLSILSHHRFVENNIVNRVQADRNKDSFFADELSLQIFHKPQVSMISQIEVLSQYNTCKDLLISPNGSEHDLICGDQWQAEEYP